MLAEALTMAGLEVEAVEERYAYLDSVVVGRIDTVTPHPNADRLKLCMVTAGDRKVSRWFAVPPTPKPVCWHRLALPGTELPGGAMVTESTLRGQTLVRHVVQRTLELGLGFDGSVLMALDTANWFRAHR